MLIKYIMCFEIKCRVCKNIWVDSIPGNCFLIRDKQAETEYQQLSSDLGNKIIFPYPSLHHIMFLCTFVLCC